MCDAVRAQGASFFFSVGDNFWDRETPQDCFPLSIFAYNLGAEFGGDSRV